MLLQKVRARMARRKRVRKKVKGDQQRPRLSVYISNRHIYAQVIDDLNGATLVAASSLSPEIKKEGKQACNLDAAKKVGRLIADKCLSNNLGTVVFDRNGFLFHGRVKALADEARASGLKF